jgi:hypothetical protein
MVPSRIRHVTRLRCDVAPIGIGPTSPSQDFPVVPQRIRHVMNYYGCTRKKVLTESNVLDVSLDKP